MASDHGVQVRVRVAGRRPIVQPSRTAFRQTSKKTFVLR